MEIVKTSRTQQALWLAVSSFSTFALGFVSAAILSRYFNKTDYGTYKQVLYVYFTLQTVFTVGLPSVFSYFIPRYSREEGKYFVRKINLLFVYLGLLFSIVLYFSSGFIAQILKNDALAEGLKIFSVFPLFTLPALGVEGLYVALKKTKHIAIYNTISKLIMLICIIVPVIYFEGNYKTAIIGWGVASGIIFIYAMYMKNKPYLKFSMKRIENFYAIVFKYSVPLMGASLVGFFIASSNQFFISRFYGTEEFAEFSNGFISLPIIAMVGGTVRAVLLPMFSKAHQSDKMENAIKSYESAVVKSIVLMLPIIIFCVAFARDIVVFIYGDLYKNSAPYFRVSLIRDLFNILPYLAVLLATGHSKIYFKAHIVSLLVLLSGSYFFSLYSYAPITIVSLYVCIEVVRHLYFFRFISKKERINLIPAKIVKQMFLIIFHILLLICLIFFFSKLIIPPSLPLLFKLIVNLILFYSLILLTQKFVGLNYLEPIIHLIKKNHN